MSFKSLKAGPFMATMMLCAAAAMPSFGAKPYDAEVEYLEAPVGTDGVPYIDTGLKPADDMGVRLRVAPLRVSADTTVCGAMATVTVDNKNVDWRWYMGFINKTDGYLSWGTSNPGTRFSYSPNTIYDILFNHFNSRNRRVEKVGGGYTFDLPITDAWPSGANQNIYLFAYNNRGTAGNTGNARIYSAQFTQGDAVVMNLVPVIKDGVGYMYDTIGETLLGKVEGSSSAEFTCGRSIIDESMTLDADADWTHLGQLLISSGVTIDLNGHTLKIVGADGDGTITDNSSGDPGLLRVTAPSSVATPVTVTTSGNMTIFRSRKSYDAEVEYLEAPLNGSSRVPYIDTGLKPSDDMGVRLRVAPLRESADTTVCGAMATVTVNNKNVDWRWYMGFIKKTDGYLSWGTANPGTRFTYTPNTIYDILFNHFNSRNRRIEKVDGGYTFDLPITDAWPSGANQNIYLFAYNNKGTAGNTGNARIYSAQFTKGNNVVMDLIPVRKDGVGYMYDKVSETLLAKVSTAPLAFTYVNDAADEAYIEGSVTLDADADWTSRGILRIDDYATIDLNGHSLTIAGAYGAGTITNSSANVGEVHFVVPTQMVQTCSLALLGNIKVFKEGEGTLSLNRAGQTFTGGVVVNGGTAKAGASCPENGGYWGAEGGTITVNSGATFEVNGNNDFYFKNFVLNGGTLANTTGMNIETGKYGFGNVTLVADSHFNMTKNTTFLNPLDPATKVDLGGYALEVGLGAQSGANLYMPVPVENGNMSIVSGGYLALDAGTVGGSSSLNLEMTGAAFKTAGDFSVSNYVARYTDAYNHGSAIIRVYGTFTPAGVDENGFEYFHGCEMQNGSTIDLSAKTATWDTTATGWSGTGDADGARTVTFADNATVTLDLHGRTLAKGEKVVSWIEAPANLDTLTFALDAATAEAGEELVVTDSGIYYAADEGTVAHAYWTGAVDNDVTKPGNWACTNFMGGAVADGVPGASAAVHVSGEVGFQIPASQPITYDSIVFSNVVLTNDCDWSGLAEWAIAVNSGDTVDLGLVDLNGHTLSLATHATASDGHIYDFVTLAVTSSAAGTPCELHIAVPDASTYLECSGFALSGNVKLVKDGAGRLAMTRANQTFTGGVLIAEGMGYSPKTSYPETGNYWGASNGTITVAANATFDACGNNDFYTKNFVLDGGTLANTANMNANSGGFGNVTLAADSIFKTARSIITYFNVPDDTMKIDLGGHTLTNSLVYGAQMCIPLTVENGTMVARNLTTESNGGYVCLVSGTSGGSATFNLVMETVALELHGTLSVSNYVARYTGGYNHGNAAIKVYGTFTPEAVLANGKECFHGCEMQNGSSIDLSAKTNAWSSVALGWTGTGNMDGNRTTTFADGATVGILLGTRNVKSEEKIIDWSAAAPSNCAGLTFFGQFANGRRTKLKVKDDGLYAPKKGMTIIVR